MIGCPNMGPPVRDRAIGANRADPILFACQGTVRECRKARSHERDLTGAISGKAVSEECAAGRAHPQVGGHWAKWINKRRSVTRGRHRADALRGRASDPGTGR
jgi:hypothetical protein